jgi:membrane-anchored protein YejM (alkaline phosphatase superfamily)
MFSNFGYLFSKGWFMLLTISLCFSELYTLKEKSSTFPTTCLRYVSAFYFFSMQRLYLFQNAFSLTHYFSIAGSAVNNS